MEMLWVDFGHCGKKIITVTAFCNLVFHYTDLNPYLFSSSVKCFVYMQVCVYFKSQPIKTKYEEENPIILEFQL